MREEAGVVLDWIRENTAHPGADGALGAQTPLLDEGWLDSLRIVRLVSFVESRFGVAVELEELTPENFETVEHIAAMIERARESRPG
jgi:acyl carrier protein